MDYQWIKDCKDAQKLGDEYLYYVRRARDNEMTGLRDSANHYLSVADEILKRIREIENGG